ncbi:hypothetical protein CU080_19885 [Escherichia coli]|nr:hypothetical protein CU080_19545 [Escherichia coli]ATW99735.1 hypothetical protein CU080_19630 [Escherichia coli]ATW99738.1 hypothetical protein CU080_19715 [Escherichia coli]ATW99741.1 hypothetical protein CU080_19800 [Escherichia coli]ATW99744.1 hypothetical protein CU080_19885 [Escherichia coli]
MKINYTIDYTVHRTRANRDEQYRTTANKDQHALIIIIFRLSVMKLVDDLRGDFHHSEQGRSS